MNDLLSFILTSITGSDDFKIEAEENESGYISITVYCDPSIIGLIIGKGGKTIKSIRNVLKVRAIIDKKAISLKITEKEVSL